MKKIIILLSCVLSLNAFAAESKRDLSLALMQKIGDISANMEETAVNAFIAANPDMADKKEECKEMFAKVYKKHDIVNKIMNKVATIYEEELTEEEMKAALDFYNSDMGQKLLAKQTVMAQKSAQSIMTMRDEMMQMEKEITELTAELKSKS